MGHGPGWYQYGTWSRLVSVWDMVYVVLVWDMVQVGISMGHGPCGISMGHGPCRYQYGTWSMWYMYQYGTWSRLVSVWDMVHVVSVWDMVYVVSVWDMVHVVSVWDMVYVVSVWDMVHVVSVWDMAPAEGLLQVSGLDVPVQGRIVYRTAKLILQHDWYPTTKQHTNLVPCPDYISQLRTRCSCGDTRVNILNKIYSATTLKDSCEPLC